MQIEQVCSAQRAVHNVATAKMMWLRGLCAEQDEGGTKCEHGCLLSNAIDCAAVQNSK